MTKLEKAKEIIEAHFDDGDCGLFDSRNIAGDPMFNLYDEDGLTIDICYFWMYFEVFGLTDEEFAELKDFYNELRDKRWAE